MGVVQGNSGYVELPKGFSSDKSGALCCALDGEAVVSLRLNSSKRCETEWDDVVEWCDSGRYLSHRPSFTLDPLHGAGAYYVQEASSMVVGSIGRRIFEELGLDSALVVDLCAAPGGKSTHLSSVAMEHYGERAVVVANEVIKSRAGILAQNVVRWGEGNTIVTSSDSSVLATALSGEVDLLVVDAPCSGEGMFRKDMGARAQWSEANVELCAARQRRILNDACPMLKEGGYLIYSTCTFNSRENEDNVRWLIDSGDFESAQHLIGGFGSVSDLGSHFYPSEVRGEGLFVSVLKFIGSGVGGSDKSGRNLGRGRRALKLPEISKYSILPLHEVQNGNRIFGYSELMLDIVAKLQRSRVYILMSGIEFGELIRSELKPSHNFALYAHKADIFSTKELTKAAALDFMRRASLEVSDFDEGLQLVTYKNLPLGFAKRISQRVNNMYPVAWRILL